MANNKVEIDVEAKDKKGSVKKLALDSKKAGEGLDKVATGARNAERNVKGVAQTSSNATKNFSKMAQGSGGLVAAYATLAANIFAISAAYGFLKKAGDLVALTKGQEAYALKTGKSMKLLTSRLQDATGGLLAFDEASQAAAIGTAAGLSSDQLEGLAKIAKNASVALGRDLTDSFNRLTKGAIKAEPELLDELGIILRLDKASEDYARTIGKEVKALTTFEKSQAVVNAVLEQGNQKYDDVGDNINQIARLGKAFDDLVKSIMKAVEPFASWISGALADNVEALAAAFGLLGLSISRALVPAGPQMASLASMAEASKAALMGAAAGGTGKYATAMREGDFSKGTLTAIDKGAEATGRGRDSTVVDKLKMNEAQFKKHTAIIRADNARMIAANSTGWQKYTANVKAYLLAMQAEHGKVMGVMKAAGAAMAKGMSAVLNAVAIFGMISLAITMVKEFIEYFKDPVIKKMVNHAEALTKKYKEQNEEMRTMIDLFKEADTHAANLVKQAEMLGNQSFDVEGAGKMARDLGFFTEKVSTATGGGYDVEVKTIEYAEQNAAIIKAMHTEAIAMRDQILLLRKFGVVSRDTATQKDKFLKILKLLGKVQKGNASSAEEYSSAIITLKALFPEAVEAAQKLTTVLTPNKMAVLGITETAKGFDKLIESLKHTKSEYNSLLDFGKQFDDQLAQLEQRRGGGMTMDQFFGTDSIEIAAFESFLGMQVDSLTLTQVREEIQAKGVKTRKAEFDIEIAILRTKKQFLIETRNMAPIEKDIAKARNTIKNIDDKILKAKQKINIEESFGVKTDQTKIDIQNENIEILEQEKLHAQDILDLKQRQSDVAQKIYDLGVDGKLRSAQQILLNIEQKRAKLAQDRLSLLEKEQERALTLAKIEHKRASPFSFVTQDKFDADEALNMALDQQKAKKDGIEAERKMKVALIKMEYELLDAKMAALQYELSNNALKLDEYSPQQISDMTRMSTNLRNSRNDMMGRDRTGMFDPTLPTASGAAIDQVNAEAAFATTEVADNIDRLREAKEDLTDMKRLINGMATALEEGMTNALDGLITGTMNAKQAFASMAQGVLKALSKIISEMLIAKLIQTSLFTWMNPTAAASFEPGSFDDPSTHFTKTRYGGIVTPRGKVPGYGVGGIAKGSQAGYPALLHGTEAVVPLPNGNSIPVELSRENAINNISVNVNVDNQGRGETEVSGKREGADLGRALARAVKEEMQKQKRPGGILSPYGAA